MTVSINTDHSEDLEALSDGELKAVAKSLNVNMRGRLSRETIIKRITGQQKHLVQTALNDINKELPATDVKAKEVIEQSREDVEKAIAPYVNREGYNVSFNAEDKTWQFAYRGAVDSGTMCQPLGRIIQSAAKVARGAFRLPDKSDAEQAKGGRYYHF